jgi:hypothetical protein
VGQSATGIPLVRYQRVSGTHFLSRGSLLINLLPLWPKCRWLAVN